MGNREKVNKAVPSPRSLVPDPQSLYIHVPFCLERKCDYCDFYSVPVKQDDSRLEVFIGSLLSQGKKLFGVYRPSHVPTVYIGGVTPSVLRPKGINRLLKGLNEIISQYTPSGPGEVTVEANPESADEAFLAAIRECGATRLSLGVQTFHGPSREAVGRRVDEVTLYERLALAAAYFPNSLSVDLMSGLPMQNEKTILDDIAILTGFKPAHVSFYALTVEKALKNHYKGNAEELWISGRDTLEKAGFGQYEVSNFCLPGMESRHNIRYWQMLSWLALGPGASGTVIQNSKGFRFTYPQDLNNWLTPVIEPLDTLTLIKETFLMGFRYIEGPDEDLFKRRFNNGINDLIPKTLETWYNRGLIQNDKCALNKEGLLLLDRFLIEAFEELDNLLIK